MLQNKSILITPRNLTRFASSAAAPKSASSSEIFQKTSEDGIKLTCVTNPKLSTGLSRVVCAFKSGSRYEQNDSEHGITHLLRRSFGLSTDTYTGINLTRHFEQMGAKVSVMNTREHLIYTCDVAPNLASRAGYLMAHMASSTAFYGWELKDLTYKLMHHDIDVFNRRELGSLCLDLLNEAAFGVHPDGNGLGNSLYATSDRVGSHSLAQIRSFIERRMTPGNCAITLMNLGDGHKHMDPASALNEIKSGLHLHPKSGEKSVAAKYNFVGGEIRKNLVNSPVTYVMVGCHVPFGYSTSMENFMALAIAGRALDGAIGRISYSDGQGRFAKSASLATQCKSLVQVYSDNGLFGFSVGGSCPKATETRVREAFKVLTSLGKQGLTEEEFQRGKTLFKADLLMRGENEQDNATLLTMKMLELGSAISAGEKAAQLDKMSLAQVNKVLASVVVPEKMALSAVGANTAQVPSIKMLSSL